VGNFKGDITMAIQLHPIYLASQNFTPPETGTYYLVAKDGVYLRVERKHGWAFVKVKDLPFLKEIKTKSQFTLGKLPATIVAQAITFFRKVFDEYRSESYLTLLYSSKLDQYKLWAPKQTVSYSSVEYDRTDTIPVEDRDYIGNDGDAYAMVGTIHSHCDFSAFHSGTDERDEATFDGLHLTFGNVNRENFSIAGSVVFCNSRSKVDPSTVCEGIESIQQQIETDEFEDDGTGGRHVRKVTFNENFFSLSLSDDEQLDLEIFKHDVLPAWLEKVEKSKPLVTYNPIGLENSFKNEEWEDWRDLERSKYWGIRHSDGD
jgi:hypothetical protein